MSDPKTNIKDVNSSDGEVRDYFSVDKKGYQTHTGKFPRIFATSQ